MNSPMYLHDVGIVCALGQSKAEVWQRALAGDVSGIVATPPQLAPPGDGAFFVGQAPGDGHAIPSTLKSHNSRNNRLLAQAASQLEPRLSKIKAHYGAQRIGVVVGTSTSGIEEGLVAQRHLARAGQRAEGASYVQQELGSPATFLARLLNLEGPAFVVSTACSSSARVFASARRLLRLGLVDAVVVGGGDSLASLTLAGFASLESLSRTRCNPFSLNRDGLTIGEGAAMFLISNEPGPVALCGVGSSSDAHHMSAPDPQGHGAVLAMRAALAEAGVAAEAIDYVNLHGTATRLNDSMEATAMTEVFGSHRPLASSTKPMTGHALGAAGALELALCWLTLSPLNSEGYVPPHIWDEVVDPTLPSLALARPQQRATIQYIMSNSFAFGGNNVSVVVRRER